MPSNDTLYKINDALTALANELDWLNSTACQGDQEALDDLLQDCTLAVAKIAYPDED